MRSRTPSRHGPTVGLRGRAATIVREAVDAHCARVKLALIEGGIFGPVWGPTLRRLVSRRVADRLRALASHFDAAFYARQFGDGRRRRRIEHFPLLHYILVGSTENRPPRPGFDPIFYRQSNPDVGTDDPLWHYVSRWARRSVPFNEMARHAKTRPWQAGRQAVLTIHHGRGGGSSRFLDLFEEELWRKGRNILRLRAVNGSPTLAVLEDRAVSAADVVPAKVFDLAIDGPSLAEFARRRGVTRLLVNHLIDRPPAVMGWIEDLARGLGCSYDVILHDYYVLCPRVDMVNGQGRFCGVAPPDDCVRCVEKHGSEVPNVKPLTWRASFSEFLAHAETIFVPSRDMALRLAPYIANTIQVWSPENDLDLPPERRPYLAGKDPLRVAILGALNVPKGLRVLVSLARAARLAGAPLAFTVVGPTSDPALLASEGIKVTGAYKGDDLDGLIDVVGPHVVFLPAIWPETWSFVLTVALRRGFPVVAFDIGAPAERLRRLSRGQLLALDLMDRPADLLAAFLRLRDQLVVR